ncbi:hypothetical protein RBH38_27625, partial [Escherichia coli]
MNGESITVISSGRDKNVPLWAIKALCAEGYRGQVVIRTRLFEQMELTVKRVITASRNGGLIFWQLEPPVQRPVTAYPERFLPHAIEASGEIFRVFYCPSTSA